MGFILLYSSLVVFFFYWSRISPFRFDFIYTLGLFFSSFMAVLPLLVYPSPVQLETALFIIAFHFIIIASFNVFFFVSPFKRTLSRSTERGGSTIVSLASFSLIRFLALVFCVLSVTNNLVEGKIPIISNAGLISDIRADFDYTTVTDDIFKRLVDLLSHFGVLFFVLGPLYMKRGLTTWLLPLLVFIFVIDNSIASGARSSIILSSIGFLAVYYSLNRVNIRRLVILLGLGITFVYIFAVLFYLTRNLNFESNAEFYMAYNSDGVEPYVEPYMEPYMVSSKAVGGYVPGRAAMFFQRIYQTLTAHEQIAVLSRGVANITNYSEDSVVDAYERGAS